MLSTQDNETLCRVGPGTPMGDLMRQYWMPVMLSSELPDPDGDPVRVRLLSEDLVMFRATDGRVGLFAENCSHRGASLFFGRNEKGGLRCVYHGWMYDVTGRCVDMPSEPPESNFRDKVRQRAYPCQEYGGMIWTYMGPRAEPPPMPQLEWASLPATHRRLSSFQRECNWMQALEGDIDTSHLYFLHARLDPTNDAGVGSWHSDRHPRLEVVQTDYGIVYGAKREESDAVSYWRITQFMFPIHTLFPGYPDGTVPGHIWVPLDDNHTMVWSLGWNPVVAFDDLPASGRGRAGNAGVGEFLPVGSDGLGRWRPKAGRLNDYEIDRDVQRTTTYTGIPTIPLQDQAVTESMGAVNNRTREHLGTSDAMIIQVRRRLIQAANALRDQGVVPPGVDNPEWYRVRSGSATIPSGAPWLEEMGGWLNARTSDIPEVRLAVPG